MGAVDPRSLLGWMKLQTSNIVYDYGGQCVAAGANTSIPGARGSNLGLFGQSKRKRLFPVKGDGLKYPGFRKDGGWALCGVWFWHVRCRLHLGLIFCFRGEFNAPMLRWNYSEWRLCANRSPLERN